MVTSNKKWFPFKLYTCGIDQLKHCDNYEYNKNDISCSNKEFKLKNMSSPFVTLVKLFERFLYLTLFKTNYCSSLYFPHSLIIFFFCFSANSSKNDEWLMVDNIGDIPTVTVTDASKSFEHTKSFDSAKSSESLKSGDTVKSSDTPKTPDATKSQDSDKTPDSPKLVETPTKQSETSKQSEGSKIDALKNRIQDKGKGAFKWKLKKTPKGSESPNSGGNSCEKCRQVNTPNFLFASFRIHVYVM